MEMTQEKWDSMSLSERAKVRDISSLHPLLIGLEGWRVEVIYKPGTECVGYDEATCWLLPRFIVGRTTGWKPCHLALRNRNQRGSSMTITNETPIQSVRKLGRVR